MRKRTARVVHQPVITIRDVKIKFREREFTNLFTQRRATRPNVRPGNRIEKEAFVILRKKVNRNVPPKKPEEM